MVEQAVFFTGAGGFIGRYILAHYLERGDCDLYLLENGRFCKRLKEYLDAGTPDPARRARARVIEGDITAVGLGLDPALRDELKERVTHVIHLAALYNLSAPREVSMRVNVEGTRNVLDFASGLKQLKRLGYMSTVAISGDYSGVYSEEDFDKGQRFKNYYAETKFLTEKVVRERRDGIPTVICRPTIVVGHSKTGAIEKIDGPYYGLTVILRRLHLVTVDTGQTKCHIAPVDYVADAFHAIFEDESAPGKVYCLGDPNPLTYTEFYDLACERLGRIKPLIRLPASIMRPVVRMPFSFEITGVTAEAFEYSVNPVEYPVTNAQAVVSKRGIACPSVPSYIDAMLSYFRQHYHDPRVRRGDWKKGTT